MQAQLQNQAGAALVIHIKWLRALFFAMAKVVESKGGTLNDIVNNHVHAVVLAAINDSNPGST